MGRWSNVWLERRSILDMSQALFSSKDVISALVLPLEYRYTPIKRPLLCQSTDSPQGNCGPYGEEHSSWIQG